MSTSSPNISNRHQDSGIPTYPRAQMQTPLRLSACLPVCQLDLCLHVRNTYKIGCVHTHVCACVHVPMHRCLYLFVSISDLPTEDQLSVPYTLRTRYASGPRSAGFRWHCLFRLSFAVRRSPGYFYRGRAFRLITVCEIGFRKAVPVAARVRPTHRLWGQLTVDVARCR